MIKLTVHEKINLLDNIILFKHTGDIDMYQTQINQFIENNGVTIQNPTTNIPVYRLPLNQWGSSLICGNIINNINVTLKKQNLENIILIMDFDNITEISESFCEEFFRFILSTKSKVININQNTSINSTLVSYINSVVDYQEV